MNAERVDELTSGEALEMAITMSRVEGVVSAMMNTLLRTARSGVINNGRDFSCCIVTAGHELVAMAESQPVHVFSGPELMTKVMCEFHPTLRPGVAFLHNSPYHGNSHPADHSILVPVFDADGIQRFTVVVKAHQADCGNSRPTTYFSEPRDVYEEGALIFPCVKVQEDYCDIEDIVRMCKVRIRVPDQWWGDYLALIGAARLGERELSALGDELGWGRLDAQVAAWFDHSERRMENAIRSLPTGEVKIGTSHDPFPGVPDGIPIVIALAIRSQAGRIEVDLRSNPDCKPCGLNLTEATARTAVMLGVFNAIGRTIPPNAGSFRRLTILLREGCVVGIPRHPVSCSVATTNLFDRVANGVQRGVAELADGFGLAEVGLSLPAAWSVISGRDPRFGDRPFINQLILPGVTGGAGGPSADGWVTLGGVGDAGQPFRDSVEIDELAHPIRIYEQRLVPDCEGPGKHRGAPAAYVEFGPVNTSLEVMFASDGSMNPARGVRGGGDGSTAKQLKRLVDGELLVLDAYSPVVLLAGETVISICGSGGGYGDPRERDPKLVREDVRTGWISPERAMKVYGVDIRDRPLDESARLAPAWMR